MIKKIDSADISAGRFAMISFRADDEVLEVLKQLEAAVGEEFGYAKQSDIIRFAILCAGAKLEGKEFPDPPWSHITDGKNYCVYFIRRGVDGPIKIGRSGNVVKRMEQLRTSNAEQLVLLATMPGTHHLESELHKQFANTRLHGEWFSPSAELLEFIRGLKS